MDTDLHPIVPTVSLQCPINSSLRVLGRKWALLVLRDIGFMASIENGGTAGSPKLTPRAVPVNFSQILRGNPGLSPRLLCMRLKELQTEGLIEGLIDPPGSQARQVSIDTQRQGCNPSADRSHPVRSVALSTTGLQRWKTEDPVRTLPKRTRVHVAPPL